MHPDRIQNPHYGRGFVDLGSIDFIDEQEVKLRLINTFRSPDYKPPTLPAVAMEVMGLSQRADVSFGDVTKVLEQDGVLTGTVLKVAQSSAFAGRQRITSIHQAMVRIGLQTVRNIVLQVALTSRVFRSQSYGPAMNSLRRHSTAVAHIARAICKYTPFDGEFAFMCGVLHDVGIAGALIALTEQAKPLAPPSVEEVWPAVIATHEEAAAMMAKMWCVPEDVCLVLGAHHRVKIQGHPHPMAATVAMAGDIANQMGFGLKMSDDKKSERLSDEPELDAAGRKELSEILGLEPRQLELIASDTERVLPEVMA